MNVKYEGEIMGRVCSNKRINKKLRKKYIKELYATLLTHSVNT